MPEPEVVIVTQEPVPRVIVQEGGGGGDIGAAIAAHDADEQAHPALLTAFAALTGQVNGQLNDIVTGLAEALDGKVSTTGGGMEGLAQASVAGSHTVSLSDGNVHDLTLTDDVPLSLGGATNGRACTVTLLLRQDATGGREASWPGTIEWVGGSAPVLQADPEAVDVVTLLSVDGGTTWLGFHAAGGGGGAESDPVASAALADHLADATDAHDAAAISFAPAGSIAAQNVQAAIEEVAAEGSGGISQTDLDETIAERSFTPGYVSGQLYACGPPGMQDNGLGNPTLSRVHYIPFVVTKTQSFDRIATYIGTVGGAGNVCRLGIRNAQADGKPGTLVLDAGTVATDTGANSTKTITISQQLTPGLYFAAIASQGGSAAQHRRCSPGYATAPMLSTSPGGTLWYEDSITGAFASAAPPSPLFAAIFPPLVLLRAA